MITLLIDTCVWLDIAKDYRQRPTLDVLEDLLERGEVRLAVPQIVLDEFARNKARVIADSTKSLSALFKRVKGAVDQFGQEGRKGSVLGELDDIDHRMATMGEVVNASIAQVERMLSRADPIKTTEAALARAAERALNNRAPFHRKKNSMGDAVLIELFADLLAKAEPEEALAFITHNKHDFSDTGKDERLPHPDLASLFDEQRSTYSLALGELLSSIDPEALEEAAWIAEYEQQPRRLAEILEAEQLLFRNVWYNRHWNLRHKIEIGEVFLVSEDELSFNPVRTDECLDTVWEKALAAAKRTEDEIGLENLGPWDDFEWGMLNGKLSALRWVMGDDWDFLDT